MTPRQIVENWIERFNAGDAAGLADLYEDDAINHQVALEPVQGRDAIKAMFARDFERTKLVCIPEIIHEAGDVAALEWLDPSGVRGCGFFTIRNDKIAFQRGYWDASSFERARQRSARQAAGPLPPEAEPSN